MSGGDIQGDMNIKYISLNIEHNTLGHQNKIRSNLGHYPNREGRWLGINLIFQTLFQTGAMEQCKFSFCSVQPVLIHGV